MTTLYIDGLCEPINPKGVGAIGYVLNSSQGTHQYGEVIGYGQGMTNNVAEYRACIKGLEDLVGKEQELVVCTDSQLMAKQLKGEYAVRAEHLVPLHRRVRQLAEQFQKIRFEWILGTQNTAADEAAWKAYEDFLDKNPVIANQYQAYWASRFTQQQLQQMGITRKYVGEQTAKRLMTK